jgi:malyl-CoA/(S)-citramalyl-CoA lyase
MLEKAPDLGADIVMLDLEDAVAPDDKVQARVNIIEALLEQDWSRCSVSLRINGLDTPYCYRDIVDVVEQAGHHLDAIMIPKAGSAGDVHFVNTLLTQVEDAVGLQRRLGLAVLIETALEPARSGWRRWCSASPTTRRRCRATPPRSVVPTPITRS